MNFCFVFSYEPWLLPSALEMIDVIKEQGHGADVIFFQNSHTNVSAGDYDATLTYAAETTSRLKHYFKSSYLEKHIRRLLVEKKVDVVIACDVIALQALSRIKTKTRKGYWCFEIDIISKFISLDRYRLFRMKSWLKKIDFYLTPNESRKDFIRQTFDATIPGAVIYNSRKLTTARTRTQFSGFDGIRHKLVYTGRVSPAQFIREMIEAMELVTPDAGLIIAGQGDEEYITSLKNEIAGNPLLKNRVFYLGRMNRDGVYDLIDWADIGFVLYKDPPGRRVDAAPNKLGDYISGGMWMIGSNQEYIKYWLEERKTGVCVDEVTKQSLADAINRILTEPAFKDKNVLTTIYHNELNMNVQFEKLQKLISTL